jgi:phage terminase large subunit
MESPQPSKPSQVEFPPKFASLFRPKRTKVLCGGRGGAKSWNIARALVLLGARKTLRVLCAREFQNSIEDSSYQLLKDQINLLGLTDLYAFTQTEIRGANGTVFLFKGLKTDRIVESLKSLEAVDVTWVEEAARVSARSWDLLTPTIFRRDAPHGPCGAGSELWVSFNPDMDTDPTYVRFVQNPSADTEVIFLTYRDNPWFPKALDAERRAMQERDPVGYENVWEGKCRSSVDGAIYTREVQALIDGKRVRQVPYDPMLAVHTVWDLGFNDQTSVIMVQRQASELRIVGYLEESGLTLAEWTETLKAHGYRWGTDWLPHDGKAKSVQTGRSPQEILQQLGRSVNIVPNVGLEQGIKIARMVFPRVYFDQDRCERLLECLKRYRRSIPTSTNEPGAPLHDEFSHGADAFRYLAVIADKMDNNIYRPVVYPRRKDRA